MTFILTKTLIRTEIGSYIAHSKEYWGCVIRYPNIAAEFLENLQNYCGCPIRASESAEIMFCCCCFIYILYFSCNRDQKHLWHIFSPGNVYVVNSFLSFLCGTKCYNWSKSVNFLTVCQNLPPIDTETILLLTVLLVCTVLHVSSLWPQS